LLFRCLFGGPDGHRIRYGHFGKEKNFFLILGIEPRISGRRAIDVITLLTELTGLSLVSTGSVHPQPSALPRHRVVISKFLNVRFSSSTITWLVVGLSQILLNAC
jgi:hypothetical protein